MVEVITPGGHTSSYPSHRHDEDDFPRMTYLEETYYHRLDPGNGWAIQRVYTDDGGLDDSLAAFSIDIVETDHLPFGQLLQLLDMDAAEMTCAEHSYFHCGHLFRSEFRDLGKRAAKIGPSARRHHSAT